MDDNKRNLNGEMRSSSVSMYVNKLEDKILTRDEEIELVRRIELGDTAAKYELIEKNLRLVVNIAKRYVSRGLTFLDLIQEGNIGLIKAIDKFDLKKGHRFSMFATYCIRSEIILALMNKGKTIRIPTHVYEKINRFKEVETRLVNEYGRDPKIEEIADELWISLREAIFLLELQGEEVSINSLISDTESKIEDYLISYENLPEEEAILNSMTSDVWRLIEMCDLEHIEFDVLMLRFGFNDTKPLTLEEIGKKYGLSKERIRQIETKALNKIRKSKYIKDFAIYMDNPDTALQKIRA